jgi:hypothetical protein
MAFREFFFHFCSTEWNSELCSLPRNGSERSSESLLLFLFHGTELRVVFSSAEWFGSEFREFLFQGTEFRVVFSTAEGSRNGVMRVCFYFYSTERNSELFSLPRKGSERNSESFLFGGTAGIRSEITICSVYYFFRGIFLSEITNPNSQYAYFTIIYHIVENNEQRHCDYLSCESITYSQTFLCSTCMIG